MARHKKGLVLLPFLAEDQLYGFYTQECVGEGFETFYGEWLQCQENFSLHTGFEQCKITSLSDDEHAKFFASDPRFEDFYAEKNVKTVWLANFLSMIPLKPFISLNDCEETIHKLKEGSDPLRICLKKEANPKPSKVSLQRLKNDLIMSIFSSERGLTVRGIEAEENEETNQLQVTFLIGNSSPFIEVIKSGERFFLVNGLQRLYSLGKVGKSDTQIPCVLFEHDNFAKKLENHPYHVDVIRDERPPLVRDFLDATIAYEINIQAGLKHLQIFTKETLVPTDLLD